MSENGRYDLRSSVHVTDEWQDYDSVVMDDRGESILFEPDSQCIDSQMDQYMIENFGTGLNNMSTTDVHYALNGYAATPTLFQLNLEGQKSEYEESAPSFSNEKAAGDYDANGYTGGFCYSQDRQQYKFVVAAIPQSKSTNMDYLSHGSLLFVKYNTYIPFNFMITDPVNTTSKAMPCNMAIRISLLFETPISDDQRAVGRCDVHMKKDIGGANTKFAFIVNNSLARYNPSTLSVIIPTCTVASLKFCCYSSCAGGIDRKRVFLLFELLNEDGSVSQEAKCSVKVCANPSRDAPKESERKKKEGDKMSRTIKVKPDGDGCGRKRKGTEEKQIEAREYKRMDSTSHRTATSSPMWNSSAMSLPPTNKRPSKMIVNTSRAYNDDCGFIPMEESDGEDSEAIYEIKIQGKKKYEKVMELVRILEQNERYAASKNEQDNWFANLTQLTGDTSISSWLAQYKLCDEKYVSQLNALGVFVLDDVNFTPTLFRSVGISRKDAAKLNMIYLNWLNVSKSIG